MGAQLEQSFEELVVEVERRKHRERELEESEARLRTQENRIQLAVKAANFCIWDWDVEKDELLWDDSMHELYGVEKGAFGGTFDAWLRCLLPEDVVAAKHDVEAALRGEKDFETAFRIRRSDGSVRLLRGTAATLRGAGGTPQRMVGINWDVTDAQRLEHERGTLLHDLGERIKELKLLHSSSRLLQRDRPFDEALLAELVQQIPAAWQYPECCEARIGYLGLRVATAGWRDGGASQFKYFSTSDGEGVIEVTYTEARPSADEGPFLDEERAVLDSLTEMLVVKKITGMSIKEGDFFNAAHTS
jgi:PAS domain S-box-containing protein